MTNGRVYTGRIGNPLRNADPASNAAAVYTEVRPYGPAVPLDQPGGPTSPFNDDHRWAVDPAADSSFAQVRAVFDGDLYIASVVDDSVPDADKLVWLALRVGMLVPMPLPPALARSGILRTPWYAFYGNVRYASLAGAMATLGYGGEALSGFLDLTRLTTDQRGVLPVFVGEIVGELGEITLDDGSAARALDFKLAMNGEGGGAMYPDAFYADVLAKASHRLAHYNDLTSPDLERDPTLSVWSVCEPRVVVRCNDEWNHPLGQYRAAQLTLVRDDGAQLAWSYPQVPSGQEPIGAVALTTWAAGHSTATLTVRPHDEPTGPPLLLSAIPSTVAASESLALQFGAPLEAGVQAVAPDDWFPAPGGKGWDPAGAGAHTTITLAAPHAVARWTNFNTITPLVDGNAYLTNLAAEMDRVTAADHWVCQAGWWIDHDMKWTLRYDPNFDPPAPIGDARTPLEHWQRIAGLGAQQFALVWNPIGGPSTALPAALPAGPVKDMWTHLQDYEGALQVLAVGLVDAEFLGGAFNPSADAVSAHNTLVTGPAAHEAILDGRHRPGASHHAKMAVVRNADGLVAYVGGIDVNENRVNSVDHFDYLAGTGPYHDVQCRVEGPAARDVLRTFLSRWNDHPTMGNVPSAFNGKTGDLSCTALGFQSAPHLLELEAQDDRTGGTSVVQIGRTFGNCRGLQGFNIDHGGDFVDNNGYDFAPDGEFTIEAAILGAVKRAKRYVYIEDQFLGNMKMATVIAAKIAERKVARAADPAGEEPFYVDILVPYFPNASRTATNLGLAVYLPDALLRLGRFMAGNANSTPALAGWALDLLAQQSKFPDKIESDDPWGYLHTRWYDLLHSVDPQHEHWGMHCLRLPPYQRRRTVRGAAMTAASALTDTNLEDRRTYIHSKIVIVDDVWATIGSANMNVRSYTNDTEINCSYIDGRTDEHGLRVSVRDLRRELWADHLGMDLADVPVEPPNSPESRRIWESQVSPTAEQPESRTGRLPFGSRLYDWPYNEVQVGASAPPVMTWTREGDELRIEPYGVTELPKFWWIVEEFGKAPWAPDVNTLMPPRIGTPRFAIDGVDGAIYQGFDLVPH